MKKLLLTAAAILATLNMYGQGQGVVSFGNVNSPTPSARIWVNNTGNVGDGAAAAGTGYHIALYWGNQGTPEDGLAQAGAAVGFLSAGMFSGGNRTLTYSTGTGNGAIVTVQARAWSYLGAGTPDTYEQALALGATDPRYWTGKGPVFDDDTFRPGDPTDPATAIGGHAGWRGFAISPVPEPSVIGLGLLGAGALLMLRRRK